MQSKALFTLIREGASRGKPHNCTLHSSISIFNFNDAFFDLNDSPVVMCVEVCSLPLVIVIGSEQRMKGNFLFSYSIMPACHASSER